MLGWLLLELWGLIEPELMKSVHVSREMVGMDYLHLRCQLGRDSV